MKVFSLLYAQVDIKNCIVYLRDGTPTTPKSLQIKIGEGNLTYDEKKARQYYKDRGRLSNVRDGDQDPIDVKLDATWEFIKADVVTGGIPTIEDALKQRGNASAWVTSGADPCEPYSVDIYVVYDPSCVTSKRETILLPEFRYESINHDLRAGSFSISGKCNATQATVARVTNTA